MSAYAIGMNKKVPFLLGVCETLEQAEAMGTASDAEDYAACSAGKLSDLFTLSELAAIFNSIPGDERVERFSDKASAVKRIAAKAEANKEALAEGNTKRKAAKRKATAKESGRPRARITGIIKAVKNEGKRWQKDSPRSLAYALLLADGPMTVEEFIGKTMKHLKATRPQVLGIITKLRAVRMAEVG